MMQTGSRLKMLTMRLWLSTLVWFSLMGIACAEVRSIQEFLKFQDHWEDFAVSGYVWKLEGRYAVISDNTLTFVKCSLPFQITEQQGDRRGSSGVVEVTGRIIKKDKELVFRVEQLSPRPRDLERVKSMRFGIDTQQADEWYQVADWARERGKFYDDKELIAAAYDLDRNGILTELRQLKETDEEGFNLLLKKARSKQMDDGLIQQMIHDSLWARLRNIRLRPNSDPALRDLLVQIRQDLPGASDVLPTLDQKLQQEYLNNPKSTYASASPEVRRQLARLFALDVIVQRILLSAREDGSNGFEIADRLSEEAPERADLIAQYNDLGVAAGMKKVQVATRSELLAFADRLTKLGRNDQVIAIKKQWLQAREPLFRQDGARGLADLGQLWISLLGNEETAARFYIESWQENPQYTPAINWLRTHGYKQVQETWMLESEIPKMPLTPRELAIREGRVELGMTANDVQAALGTQPTSITRLASRRQITEWWTYESAGVVIKIVTSKRNRQSQVVSVDRLQTP